MMMIMLTITDHCCFVVSPLHSVMLVLLNRGTAFVSQGHCPTHNLCLCPHIYLPVCGQDGVTYNNECLMRCAYVAL